MTATQLRGGEATQRFLLEFSDALRAVTDAAELQRIASGLLGRHLGVAGVHYAELREDEGLYIVGPDYHCEHYRSLAGTYRIADFGEMMSALRGGRPVAIDDVEAAPLLSGRARATYRRLGVRAFAAAPLVRDGRLVWTLAVLCTQPRAWTPAEVELVQECGERTWGDVQRLVAEAALRESHEALEARVAERTRELEAMRREAERANAAKSRFLAAASHDLRQPLQTMHIAIELLGRSLHEPAAALPLQKLAAAARTMDELLATLLDVDRLEQGALVPHVVDFRLRPLLARLRSELGWTADAKGIRLAIDDCDAVVRSDPSLLDVMLRNLVGNAIKFTARGGVHVSFVRDGDALRIDVRDTGIGIATEHLGHVFDDYYQAPGGRETARPGVGLGLAIVQQIGRALGHEVTVQSAVGVGTTFSLKVARGDGRPAESAVTPQAASRAPRPCGDGRHVLHVEDDPGIAESLGMLLALEGYRVTSVRSAAEALAALEQGPPPDVIVTDYQLPQGVTGLQLLHEVAKRRRPRPPTIVMSGDISERLAIEGAQIADRILRKPVEGATLLREIDALFDGVRARSAPAGHDGEAVQRSAAGTNGSPRAVSNPADRDTGGLR